MSTPSELIAEAQQVAGTARVAFAPLSSAQMNWKPSPTKWSIAQCLEHLTLLNTSYFPRIEKILAGERSTSVWERVPLLPAFFARLVLSAVQPESKGKVKARTAFMPESGDIDIGILARF